MESVSYIAKTSGIKLKDKVGYAMGDVASLLVFGIVTSLLQKFYTDVLFIAPASIMALFTVARIWDAINDPIWGRVVDTRRVGKHGRYRPWLVWLSVPLAISAVLMVVKIPGLTTTGYFIYACITYTLFGMLYTGTNIPYGSLASVVTSDEKERSSLSVFRSVGSTLGAMPAIVLASLCYDTVQRDGEIIKTMSAQKILIGAIVLSVLSIGAYYLCFRWSKERVPSAPAPERKKGETMRIIKMLFKSRAFVSLCLASMMLLAAQMFTQSYYTYLFDYYFNAPGLYTLVMVCQYLPVAVIMFFVGKLVRKVGRKEICALGMLLAGVANLALYLTHTTNPYIFLFVCFLSGVGTTFFFLQVWALATDTIDYNEVRSGFREDATSYAFYSFTRKLGQAVAAILANAALIWIAYDATLQAQTPATLEGMFSLSVLIPAALYIIMFVILWFFYPINKKALAQLQIDKEQALKQRFDELEHSKV